MVNNFAPPKKIAVNNSTFTRSIQVNTPGLEDEYLTLNARRFSAEFRSRPGALMQRNSQSPSPAGQAGRDEPSIRRSILQGPRVQPNQPIKLGIKTRLQQTSRPPLAWIGPTKNTISGFSPPAAASPNTG
jgi:hypothetical protein